MFVNGITNSYKEDYFDTSLHSGIPRRYYNQKDKQFNDWEIPPWELFIFKDRLLGEGTFAKVYLAKWRETFVVAKSFNENNPCFDKKLIIREIDIMAHLHHPNITQFLGYIDDPFIIVMEYIPNKNLQDNITKLSKSSKISIMKDVLRGLAYLHNRRPYSLVHRDIKPSNIILTNSRVAKIADFGLSKFYNYLSSSNDNLEKIDKISDISSNLNIDIPLTNDLTHNVGTERYMAPELENNNIFYDNKIDIYSCGIVFYEIFENKKYNKHKKLEWFWTPKYIKNIINNYMINETSNKRLNALQLIRLIDNH